MADLFVSYVYKQPGMDAIWQSAVIQGLGGPRCNDDVDYIIEGIRANFERGTLVCLITWHELTGRVN